MAAFCPCTEYHNSRENKKILCWKYLVDIRTEAWLNLFHEYINGKLFAVRHAAKVTKKQFEVLL
jgi:hypothetical protein